MSDNNDFWQKQYELIAKILSDESNRFWTRFNMALLINAGLVVAFSTILANIDNIPTEFNFSMLGITVTGLATSILWAFIIEASRGAQDRLNALGKDIESNHSEIEAKYFGEMHRDKLKGHITKRAFWYPIIFSSFWGILTIMIICKMEIFLK